MRKYLDDAVYFRISYAYAFSRLYELSQDPFAPKVISEAIKGIRLVVLPEVKKEGIAERYAVIFVRLDDTFENEEIIGKFNDHDMTLRQYILNYQKVKESIKAWLVDHNVDSNNLNY